MCSSIMVSYSTLTISRMTALDLDIPITFKHRIRFSKEVFSPENETLGALFDAGTEAKVIVFVENEIFNHFPKLEEEIHGWFKGAPHLSLTSITRAEGGEYCKRSETVCREVMDAIEKHKIDRHSYVWVIGGGAFLDVVGFAAATAHRGIRLVRFPTTTLSQDDSGVGVKNGINLYKKKNFLGSFAVPYAVVNDFRYLYTQPASICREGLVESVKVALVKDGSFFDWMAEHAEALARLEEEVLEECVERSAILHARHIAEGGDPFEMGSSRPLDYGHWAAHKAEQLSDFRLSHAQAVSIGVALDTLYAWKKGFLKEEQAERVIQVLKRLELPLWDEAFGIKNADGSLALIDGLDEFREHLGGRLTIMLLKDLGEGFDIHEMDSAIVAECLAILESRFGS